MMSTVARNASLSESRRDKQKATDLIARKIWLPKVVYAALPYFYIASGTMAFLATLYITEWFWILPHYVLFSAVCLHLGVIVYRRRRGPKESVAAND